MYCTVHDFTIFPWRDYAVVIFGSNPNSFFQINLEFKKFIKIIKKQD